MSVGKNIKNICAKLGINGRELAQLSKIPPTTIYRFLVIKPIQQHQL
jgi:predicted transcriptional regulator